MTPYQFETEDFGLSDNGVHLLRSRFNYKTIAYDGIASARIERTHEIKNVLLTLIFAVALGLFTIFQVYSIYRQFTDPHTTVIYIESIVVVVIPAAVCAYCIYMVMRKGPVLIVQDGGRRHKLRLRRLYARQDPSEFEAFLQGKLGAHLHLSDDRRPL